jgi:hypothetical protein
LGEDIEERDARIRNLEERLAGLEGNKKGEREDEEDEDEGADITGSKRRGV